MSSGEAAEIGPALPPGFNLPAVSSDDEDDIIGPALPPGLEIQSSKEPTKAPFCIGPALPPGFQTENSDSRTEVLGPGLPPGYEGADESGDEPVIGPLPPTGQEQDSKLYACDIERRANRMKEKLSDKTSTAVQERESWMTELPTGMSKNLGLTARSLGTGRAKVDLSWTETPKEREERGKGKSKRKHEDYDNYKSMSSRDKGMAKLVDDYNKSKRSKSLLDMHTEKVKKEKAKKKDKDEKQVRKPFDREADIKVSGIDAASKKKLIAQSHKLNSKFEHSSGQQFL